MKPENTQSKEPAEVEPIEIAGQVVRPGTQSAVGVNVGSLPSGTNIYINIFVYHSVRPGPVVTVIGGLHGDEINGVEIVRRGIRNGVFQSPLCGTVLAIPLLNVFGFINFSRNVPDGKDVNRSFPGSRRGSLASRVAHTITRHVLPLTDILIDLHTGGIGRYNAPQVRVSKKDEQSLALAKAFGIPLILQKPLIKKSLRETAGKKGIAVLVYESGEALRLSREGIETGLDGIRLIMRTFGMLEKEKESTPPKQVLIKRAGWKRASASGIFIWEKCSGDFVEKGDILGHISDPFGGKGVPVKAHQTGYIVGHANTPVVSHGDALFHIGYEYDELKVGD